MNSTQVNLKNISEVGVYSQLPSIDMDMDNQTDSDDDLEIIFDDYSPIDSVPCWVDQGEKPRLWRTEFCRNMQNTGSCKRGRCDFYHSVEERQIPMCSYGVSCQNYFWCKFCHPFETEGGWLSRTNKVYPLNVPLSTNPSQQTRKIKKPYVQFNDKIDLVCSKEMAPVCLALALAKGHSVVNIIIKA
jgi:hypothetical protein